MEGGEHVAGEVHVDAAVRASPRWSTGASLRLVRTRDDLRDAVFEGVVLAPSPATTSGVIAATGSLGVEADVLRWSRGALTFVVDLRLLETEPVAYYSDDLAVRSVAVLAELVWVVRL